MALSSSSFSEASPICFSAQKSDRAGECAARNEVDSVGPSTLVEYYGKSLFGTSRLCMDAPSKSLKRKSLQTKLTDQYSVRKARKFDRFNGMSEDEVMKRGLADYLQPGLDIVFVGINPGLAAAYAGRYYTGPGNHFWKCLHLAGFVDSNMTAKDDFKLLEYGIGFTNMVARTTKGSCDLSKSELMEGGRILADKVRAFRPKIMVFNGKISYEVFSGRKKFHFGLQAERVEGSDTRIWVMPSSSARCAQLPRAADKVPFFEALRRYRDFLKGNIAGVNESDFIFSDVRLVGFRKSIGYRPEEEDVDED